MKEIAIVVIVLAFAGVLLAKGPDAAQAPAPSSASAKVQDDSDEAGVMIDSKGDAGDASGDQDYSAPNGAEVYAEPSGVGGLPSSYGQCKGVVNEGGRSVLVLESPEDGALSFVQVTVGKSDVSWKLIGRIPRSSD